MVRRRPPEPHPPTSADLFGEPPAAPAPANAQPETVDAVIAAEPQPRWAELAKRLNPHIHLGTSSWSFPGWQGLVWANAHRGGQLAREGLAAYARHPLLRTVSLDRSFYRPMSESEYRQLADQVPGGFRFVVKAPSLICDARVRSGNGTPEADNPLFLDADAALAHCVEPALRGLGRTMGALVLQLSPMPAPLLRTGHWLDRLHHMLTVIRRNWPADSVLAVEFRNPECVAPEVAQALRSAGATWCLAGHARMPPVRAQLPVLRALWPGPLVCRWSLNARHGGNGYEAARSRYEPFNRLIDEDPDTREQIARVARATAAAGYGVFVTINNKAEGSAPLSVVALAEAIAASPQRDRGPQVSVS